jgi:hypothetical protein
VYIKNTGEWLAYIFNNDQSKADGIENNKTTIEEIQKLTNLKFN